jgi:hypothetical protein
MHRMGGRKKQVAISGIVAALILFVILFTVGTGYFLWVNTLNFSSSQALVSRNNVNLAQQSEDLILVPSVQDPVVAGSPINVDITNSGSGSVEINSIFVTDLTDTVLQTCTTGCGFGINPDGSASSVVTGYNYQPGTSVRIKAITESGNVFSTTYMSPTISTTLSSTSVPAGDFVSDSAKLEGAFGTASGTVTYFVSTDTCPSTGAIQVGDPVNVLNGVVPDSSSQSYNTPGATYYWYAVYSGDAYDAPATSPCEPLTIGPATGVTITTQLSVVVANTGSPVYDTATLSGATSNAGGTVTYYSFSGTTCSGTPKTVGTVTVASGVVPASPPVSYVIAGGYSWDAVYSGDANNNNNVPVASPCEPLSILGSGQQTQFPFAVSLSSFRFYFAAVCGSGDSNPCATPGYNDPAQLGDGYPVGGYFAYVVPSETQEFDVVYQIKVTNVDPSGRNMTLNSRSFAFLCALASSGNGYGNGNACSYQFESNEYYIVGDLVDTAPYRSGVTVESFTSEWPNGLTIPPGGSALVNFTTPTPGGSVMEADTPDDPTTPYLLFPFLEGSYSDGTPFTLTLASTSVFGSTSSFTACSPSACTGSPGSLIGLTMSGFSSTPKLYWVDSSGTTLLPCATGQSCTSTSEWFNVPSTASIGGYYMVFATDGENYAYATVSIPTTSTTTVMCNPGDLPAGSLTTCTATVSGSSGTPTGTVTFSTSGTGTFTPTNGQCTLGAGTCSVTFTPSSSGLQTITGAYGGDAGNGPSTGTFQLNVGIAKPVLTTSLTGSAFGFDPNPNSHGIAHGGSGSASVSLVITTTNPSDVVYACAYTENTGISLSISDTGGLVWTVRGTVSSSSGGEMRCWFAVSSGALSGDTITVNAPGNSAGLNEEIFSVSGANTASPFDPNLGSAVLNSGSGTSSSVSITTTSSNDLIVGMIGLSGGPGSINPGSSFTLLDNTLHGSASSADEYRAVTATQSGLGVDFSWSGNSGWVATADAFTSGSSGATIKVGASATDTAALTGGSNPTGSITFTVYSDSACTNQVFTSTNPISGSAATSNSFTFTTSGTYYWEASYPGDANNSPASSLCGASGEILTVNSALKVSVSANPSTIDNGQISTLMATASGGSGSYSTFAFYRGSSCTGTALQTGSSNTYTTSALTSSTTFCVEVTDSIGDTAMNTVTVTVNPALSVSISPSSPSIDTGQSVKLTATASGGAGGYSYQWYSNSGCTVAIGGATSSTYTTPTLTTTTTYCVKVTDSLSGTAMAPVTVTVNPTLSSVTLGSFTTNPVGAGQPDGVTVSWVGGTSNYGVTLYYTSSPTPCSSSGTQAGTATGVTTNLYSFTFNAPASLGTYYYCATVTDSLGESASSSGTYSLTVAKHVTRVQQVAGVSETDSSNHEFTCTLSAPTQGDLIMVAFTYYSSSSRSVSSVTDSRGSSFSVVGPGVTDTGATLATTSYIYVASAASGFGSDRITVTLSGFFTAAYVTCSEWSGVIGVAPVTTATNANTGTSTLSASVSSFTPTANNLVYAYVGYTSCSGSTVSYNGNPYTSGGANGADYLTGATCSTSGSGHNYVLNDADEYVLDWGSGSTTSSFSIAQSHSINSGTAGWEEIVVQFDPPAHAAVGNLNPQAIKTRASANPTIGIPRETIPPTWLLGAVSTALLPIQTLVTASASGVEGHTG